VDISISRQGNTALFQNGITRLRTMEAFPLKAESQS
jgi:hypothetical protein